MPVILAIVVFAPILLAITMAACIPERKKQKTIQAHSEELCKAANRAKSSQLFTDLMQRIQKEICERERGYAKYLSQQLAADSDNWAKNMAKSMFQIWEDGLYDCKQSWYSDDNSTRQCIVKFADLGYSNLTIMQIEALTTALGNALENYKPSYRTDIASFSTKTDRDRIAQFSQKVIDDPVHYSEKMTSGIYRGEKKILCNLCPTEEYLR